MELNFPIVVKNKRAFMKLMEAIEKERPEILWNAGERPTGYSPPVVDFPIEIRLNYWSNNNKMSYHHINS